ncbi:ABC transporter permease [Bacillus changyiensis]|uniref:ABC transporter permease n=1 Tax=Bacillus changyiensis TaxID=3004103 RepID=UPI0022E7804E|nr:ABC transporter permease [Bacillus changyiensis]MDA1477810.1 ABC transporter permease [Bacillus changyiensis]
MIVFYILWRNMKWRFQNPLSIIITISQPILWLLLYSAVANGTMQHTGIDHYPAYILPGIIILVTMAACSSTGIINFIMKSNGSFYRLLIAPMKRSSIVLGQMLEAVLCTFLEVSILYSISLLFGVRFPIDIIDIFVMILLIFLTAFFMSGLTYTLSLLLPNEVIYETMMNLIVLPIFFLSTALFPVENVSSLLKTVINLNPFTHVINVLRSIILGETISPQTVLSIIALFVFMCVCSLGLALWRLNKETAS